MRKMGEEPFQIVELTRRRERILTKNKKQTPTPG